VSDHRDTPDPRTDITDLYVFQAPGRGDRSVLVLNINPDASALESSFDPLASYELKIDTDGDFEADVAFHILFASSSDRGSTATVYRSTGAAARGTGPIGEVVIADAPVSVGGAVQVVTVDRYRFYSGLRSDPFFLDADGLRNGFQFTGLLGESAYCRKTIRTAWPAQTTQATNAQSVASGEGRLDKVRFAPRPGTNR
jgi:hypothetical protein